jgi:hypothetical protein
MTFDVRFVDQARRDLASLLSLHPELEEDDVLRQDMIEGETNALELIDNLIEMERVAASLENSLKFYILKMEERKHRFADRRIGLRRFIQQIMEAANLKKVERPAATVSIATGRPKVVIVDESQIPDAYWRIKREVNKEAIATTLKALRDVPGTTLSNPEPVLRIS